MVITSAVGLGVLCMALMGPALVAIGLNKKAIGAIFVTSGAVSLVLIGGSTAAASKACSLTILDYVFFYKIPAGLPVIAIMAVAHFFLAELPGSQGGLELCRAQGGGARV